jgi:hypothetical protein
MISNLRSIRSRFKTRLPGNAMYRGSTKSLGAQGFIKYWKQILSCRNEYGLTGKEAESADSVATIMG